MKRQPTASIDRRQFVALALAAGMTVLPLAACAKSHLEEAEEQYVDDYAVAVVRSTQQMRSSYIDYYDGGMSLLRSVWYPYAGLSLGSVTRLAVLEDMLYLIPKGLMAQEDDRKLISLDLRSGAVREFLVDQVSLKGVAVDDEYCYLTSNLNGAGYISRVDRASGEAAYFETPGVFPSDIFTWEDRVCAFCTNSTGSANMACLSTYSRNLELISTLNLTSTAGITLAGCPTAPRDGRICFVSSIQPTEDNQPFVNSLYAFDIRENNVVLLCELEHEAYATLSEGARVFVFCFSRTFEDTYIDMYDSTTGELLSSLHTDYAPLRGLFCDNSLFVDGNAGMAYVFVRYRLDGLELIEDARAVLADADDDAGPHPVGFFVRV
ncbi:MAG: hypothetical protein LBU31_00775 [Coriobacteriales bacterium]|jgi:hypothetical protein|nr:hypothetical protein [Coriobacteriales bacterium]